MTAPSSDGPAAAGLCDLSDLYEPKRHVAQQGAVWSAAAAQAAIWRIYAAAEQAVDGAEGGWLLHPKDDPPGPGTRSVNAYWGATGVIWALRALASQGAYAPARDFSPWIDGLPARAQAEAADEPHGSASFLFGESAPLLLAWQTSRRAAWADHLHDLVRANLHNPAHEPLWGNGGTLLAAMTMAEAELPAAERARWQALVRAGVQALLDDMVQEPEAGHWLWRQDMNGRVRHHLGAGHGLAGNAFAVLRAAGMVDGGLVDAVLQRCHDTLSATALRAVAREPGGDVLVANWHPVTERARISAALAAGQGPLVQDCHGATGIVCRLAMQAAAQAELTQAQVGQGRHSLWTGDLGVACVLWNCLRGTAWFPMLDQG